LTDPQQVALASGRANYSHEKKLDHNFLNSTTDNRQVPWPTDVAGLRLVLTPKTKKGDNMPADVVTPEVQTQRRANYQIAPLLLDRWSPRQCQENL